MTKYFVDTLGAYIGGFDGEDVELPANGIEVPSAPASASDKWVDGAWVSVPVVPESIPMLNAHLAMIAAGWFDDVELFINAMAGDDGKVARAYWHKAQTMRRDNQLVAAYAAYRNKTPAEVDALFIAGGALNV